MEDLDFTLENIKDLLLEVNRNEIHTLTIEQENFKLEIKGKRIVTAAPQAVSKNIYPEPQVPVAQSNSDNIPVSIAKGNLVTSPIVGTFYQSPAPDQPAFVSVGSAVKQGDTLFIIESMKLMNEVISEHSGTVTEIHIKDGAGVEYGQPILTIV